VVARESSDRIAGALVHDERSELERLLAAAGLGTREVAFART
jgi:hypothetical protein